MNFGILTSELSIPLNEEKAIVVKEHISITSADSYFGWYPLPNIPADTDINDIYVFSNNCYVSYEKWYQDKYEEDVFRHTKYIDRPILRKNNATYEVYIGFLNYSNSRFEEKFPPGKPAPYLSFYGRANLVYYRAYIKKVNINIKVCVVTERTIPKNIPKYGITVYDNRGRPTFISNNKKEVKFKRYRPTYQAFRLEKDEYILINTIWKFSSQILQHLEFEYRDKYYIKCNIDYPVVNDGVLELGRQVVFTDYNSTFNQSTPYGEGGNATMSSSYLNRGVVIASIPD